MPSEVGKETVMGRCCGCVEIPRLTKCCFCFPLRKGVIALGYFQLVLSMLVLGMYGYALSLQPYSIACILVITGTLLDLVMCIILLFGLHMKKPLMIKTFFYYALVANVLELIVSLVGIFLMEMPHRPHEMETALSFEISALFLHLCVSGYFLVVIWNTFLKVKRNQDVSYIATP